MVMAGATRPRVGLLDFGAKHIDYAHALDEQRRLQQALLQNRKQGGDATTPLAGYVMLLEHAPVYTLGRGSSESHLLNKHIQTIRTERGGEVTYHGPGQLVGYLVLDLEYFKKDLHCLVSGMERAAISTLQQHGVPTARAGGKGKTGVWVDDRTKICAVGLSCKQWVTMHGFALNVTNQALEGFDGIVPCGLSNTAVTSMEQQTGKGADMASVKSSILTSLEQVFGMEFTPPGQSP